MKKSLIKNAVKFMQNTNNINHSVHAELAQCDYVRSTVVGGGGEYLRLLSGFPAPCIYSKNCYNSDMAYHDNRNNQKAGLPRRFAPRNELAAFTLAEVLITLGIIGVVAAMTLPSLITKINNRGYAERLIKTYSVIQNATNKIIEEEGDPVSWSWSDYRDSTKAGNDNIVNLYKKNLSVAKHCVYNTWGINDDCSVSAANVKYLNGSMENVTNFCGYSVFTSTYPMLLADGVYVGISFAQNANGGGVMWGHPDIAFTIDINGKKGPNQIGRDIFYLYMDKDSHGKVLPFTNEKNGHGKDYDFRDTCDVTKTGQSCAYRVISEGKMNY